MDGSCHSHAKYPTPQTSALRPTGWGEMRPRGTEKAVQRQHQNPPEKVKLQTYQLGVGGCQQKPMEQDGLWRLSTSRKGPPMCWGKKGQQKRRDQTPKWKQYCNAFVRSFGSAGERGKLIPVSWKTPHNYYLAPVTIDVIHMPNTCLLKQMLYSQLKEGKHTQGGQKSGKETT